MATSENAALPSNLRWFIAFRVFFNCRFYYPILGILFVDLGLTPAQYALMNVFWAVAIVVCEVPSGALADQIGRKRLVVAAAAIMVVEMLVFALAPSGNPWLLFWMLALNRILSGIAEAAASGADEALAFDSLPESGRDELWARALRLLGGWQSAGFLVAMIVGGLIYDPGFWSFTGLQLNRETVLRLPIYATLVMSFFALYSAARLKEDRRPVKTSVTATYRTILQTGVWILHSRAVLLVILIGLLNDSLIRLFLTFNSNYYRLIGIPVVWFGVLGASFSVCGFILPGIAAAMTKRFRAPFNFAVVSLLTLAGLTGIAFARNWTGIVIALVAGGTMFFTSFFVSYYLNQWIDSERRATVLSFRGLAFNIGYGAAGLAFAQVLHAARATKTGAADEVLFGEALPVLPLWFAAGVLIVLVVGLVYRPDRNRA